MKPAFNFAIHPWNFHRWLQLYVYIYMLIIYFEGTGSFHEKKYLHPINLDCPQMDAFYNCTWIYIYIYIYAIYIRASTQARQLSDQLLFSFSFLSSLDQHILTSTSQAICNSAYNANVKCSVMNHDKKHFFSVSWEKDILI